MAQSGSLTIICKRMLPVFLVRACPFLSLVKVFSTTFAQLIGVWLFNRIALCVIFYA